MQHKNAAHIVLKYKNENIFGFILHSQFLKQDKTDCKQYDVFIDASFCLCYFNVWHFLNI